MTTVVVIPQDVRSILIDPQESVQVPPTIFVKDVPEILDYLVDWSNVLQVGENISEVIWTISLEPGSTAGLSNQSSSFTNSCALIWLAGGVVDSTYEVNCQIGTTTTTS